MMQERLRQLPKIEKILLAKELATFSHELVARLAREEVQRQRDAIFSGSLTELQNLETIAIERVKKRYESITSPSLKPLINATGIIVHTNLGRSIFSPAILQEVSPILCGYSNLEYDLEHGKRGERYVHLTQILKHIIGCEEVLVVNNNAAAVFLILNTFCHNKEALISRGELIEIGGSFRIPEVMKESGAILKEVGTTNKTHFRDYENAISSDTAMIMKVHRSNYEIVGFTGEVQYAELIELCKAHGVFDYYDLGSGFLESMPISHEPTIKELAALNPSLVSFSGDKLLGGAQAGIIFGKKSYIDKLKKNQLLRMLRVDKCTLALLEATFRAYLKDEFDKIPTLRMIKESCEALEVKAQALLAHCPIPAKVVPTHTYVGGGALPNRTLPSIALELNHPDYTAPELESLLRQHCIIARIERDRVLLDVRTIQEHEYALLLERLGAIISEQA